MLRNLLFIVWFIGPLMPSICLAQAGRCTNATPPAPAAAYGYTSRIFCDDFANLNSIDLTNSGNPGFKWYIRTPAISTSADCITNGTGDSICAIPSAPTASTSDFAVHAGGGLDFTPHGTAHVANGGQITSCYATGVDTWVGTILPGARFYVRSNVISIPNPNGGGQLQPVLWSETLSWWTHPPTPAFAWDELNYWESFGFSQIGAHEHEWYSNDGENIPGATLAVWSGGVTNVTSGLLAVPMTLGGGTGSITPYQNDIAVTPINPATWTSTGAKFGALENDKSCLILWCGLAQTCSFGSVEVWSDTGGPPPNIGGGHARHSLIR